MTSHANQVQELVSIPALAHEEVAHRVLISQVATPALNTNVFTGVLEGLMGRLGLLPPGATGPPLPVREGISRQWASTIREAVQKTEGRTFQAGLITSDILPPGLRLDHDPSLDTEELDVMAPILTPALLSGLASNLVGLEKFRASPLSSSFEIKDSTKGFASRSPMSGTPRTPFEVDLNLMVPDSMNDMVKCETFSCEMSQPDSSTPDVTPGDISEIIINDDDDDLNKTIEELQTPVAEPTPRKKWTQDGASSSSSPSKKHATQEEETAALPLEDDLPTGVKLEHILPKWYDTLCSDHPWVHKVRCSLLGLPVGTMLSREDIDSSERFIPRATCKEPDPPEVVTKHWLPILREEGLLVECPPDQFTIQLGWVPLYTPESLTKYLPMALTAFPGSAPPSLLAVVPPCPPSIPGTSTGSSC